MDYDSESDGGNFNPVAEIDSNAGSDGEDTTSIRAKTQKSATRPEQVKEDDDDDEEEDGVANRKRSNIDNDDDEDEAGGADAAEDDDDDEEEDEEEEDIGNRPRKRLRRDRTRNQFIDIEAEVDDSDEGDEDEDGEEVAGFIAETHPDDLADLPAGADTDDRRHRELDRRREAEQQMDAEKQAALLKERYGRSRTQVTDAAIVPKRLLLPSVDDPSIWGVRCKPGKEREVVFSIIKRVEERAFTKSPLPIISAFERGGTMMGYVYVEAIKQGDILPALDGILNVYPRTKMVLVPIKEMPDLLRVTQSVQLQPLGYVRIKRGKYAGDLAQIDDVETNGLEVTLKIIPRLDYGLNEDPNAPAIDPKDAAKRKRAAGLNAAMRPPQRLFSEAEAKKKHSKLLQTMGTLNKKQYNYLNDTYINGYLIKDFKIQHLITENVNPTLEEVTKFAGDGEDGGENLDLTALAASLKANTASNSYLPGDMVEVYEGEQQGITGRAISVTGDIVTLQVAEGDLNGQNIEVPTKGLRKKFSAGDHVKVIGGSRFRDEVGMVVRIKDDRVTILSDMSMQELTVFSKDLREASDSGVAGGLGRYDIHDLVQLDPATVGCVIKVDRESLRVLDQHGSVRSIMPSQISNKIETRRHAVATDRNGSEIRKDDTVREVGGDQKQGLIVHIHRQFLFLHNREQTENSGIFVVRANNVATIAAKGGRIAQQSSGPDLSKMNPSMQRNGANGGAMAPPKSFGRDKTLGQTVTIRKGPYKGLLGIVKDSTDLEVRVELHTKSKTITVSKEVLSFKDPLTGNSIDYHTFASRGRGRGGPPGGGFGGAVPAREPSWAGSRTPAGTGNMNGGRTPAWGSNQPARTPAWSAGNSAGAGGRTPRWGQDTSGGRTPAWGDGSRTAYGGSGGKTPAWDPSSRTSYAGTTYEAFNADQRTPAHQNASSRTPAYQPSGNSDPWAKPADAPTPAAYSAPTPGVAAATPKYGQGYGAYDAPTPAAGAPTPYGTMPETPAWGGDDGPTYDED